jgi:nicotinate phosphoribosyltransferase
MPGQPGGSFTDLYQFTMADSYLEHGKQAGAVFDLHARSLPPDRGFLVVNGVQTLLDRLESFTFTDEDLVYLEQRGLSQQLLDYLDDFAFTGTIRAIPEGRIAYPYEPILQVEAPLPMAQLVETLALNTVHVETVISSKAARCYLAVGAPENPDEAPAMVDFGARRAHGIDAARAAARSAYATGFAGTSLVGTARDLDIPCFGTMAHSYVEAFEDEATALTSFARSHPDGTTLLIDTYDAIEGARRAVRVADELAEEGVAIGGLRIDSGDLAENAHRVREILDEAGHEDVRVIVSGGLDEHRIHELVDRQAPIDGFGVGTSMVTSADAPSLDVSYKLVAHDGDPVVKTSTGKHTLPGRKQVYRTHANGTMSGDVIGAPDEDQGGEALLRQVDRVDPAEATQAARVRFLEDVQRLPDDVARLEAPTPYPVQRTARIDDWLDRALERAGHEPTTRDRRPLEPAP